jgi:hypothetical protein
MNIIILITLSMPDPSLSGLASMSNSCWLGHKHVKSNRPVLVESDKHVRSTFFHFIFFLSILLKNDF